MPNFQETETWGKKWPLPVLKAQELEEVTVLLSDAQPKKAQK
jgi:hypothetical protein